MKILKGRYQFERNYLYVRRRGAEGGAGVPPEEVILRDVSEMATLNLSNARQTYHNEQFRTLRDRDNVSSKKHYQQFQEALLETTIQLTRVIRRGIKFTEEEQ